MLTRVSRLCMLNWVLLFAPARTSLSPNDTIDNEPMKHFGGTDLTRPILRIYAP